MAYNYINNTAYLNFFACVGWRETLKGENSLFVTTMRLPITRIKNKEGLLHELGKRWKRSSVRSIIDTIEGDSRFRAVIRRRIVEVATHRMMYL